MKNNYHNYFTNIIVFQFQIFRFLINLRIKATALYSLLIELNLLITIKASKLYLS